MKPLRDHATKDLGLTIVTDEVYTPPLTDATTMIQHVRSSRPDFVVFQSTNVPDDKLLVDKFAEFNLKSDRLPKIGGGGHWAVPELLKNAGAENLEGVMVGLANWPGKRLGGSGETLHGPHRRTMVRPRLDFCLRPCHDPERGAGTDRRPPTAPR